MAVSCPGCGREYDVTLFQFGRTVDCTCGARVGLEHRRTLSPGSDASSAGDPSSADDPEEDLQPRFAADSMLGGLARWLRILGYDVWCEASVEDEVLVRRALRERRWILTRDRRLPDEWRVEGVVVVEADEPMAQVREIVERLDLAPERERAFSRCPLCNRSLEPVDESVVEGRVPERVREDHEEFRRCPECGRIYWEGGHVRRMRRRLSDLWER